MGVTALTIARIHILLAFRGDVVSVKEWLFLENATQAPIEARAPMPLLEGAVRAKMTDGPVPFARVESGKGAAAVVFTGPVPPGQTKIEVEYELPRKAGMKFVKAMPYAAKAVVLMSEETEVDVVGPEVQASSVRRMGEGLSLLVARRSPVAAGGTIEFEFKGTPKPLAQTPGPVAPPLPASAGEMAGAGSGASMSSGGGGARAAGEPKPGPVRDWRQLRWLVVLALFGAFYVAIYLGGRRRAEAERLAALEVDDERRALLAKLAELSRRGTETDADKSRRERLIARLAEIYDRRDETGPRSVSG